ncbi:hypothetical protein BJF78_22530 [Pseudonocardia sp. CNS-139]|nr:hypothetical protein BJF78_22530 [Pseudonocardia sp. CNS-139]
MTDVAEERLRDALTSDLDAGFAKVVRVHSGVMYAVARGVAALPADAEDLVSEAFLRAYRALCGYRPDRIAVLDLRPWLLTILRNTARNAARDAGRRPAGPPRHEPTEHDLAEGVAAPDPVCRAEQQETRHGLGVLLAELPEVQRTAVVLRHAFDMPITEIAQVMNVKEGTAKSHISRGLQRLRVLTAAQQAVASGRRGR